MRLLEVPELGFATEVSLPFWEGNSSKNACSNNSKQIFKVTSCNHIHPDKQITFS